MIANIKHNGEELSIDLSKPLDISIPLINSEKNPIAWYQDQPEINPVIGEGFVGSVAEGFSVNFNNINFNPHAHGTHTECIGHITKEFYSVNNSLNTYFYKAQLITVSPEQQPNGDLVITKDQVFLLLKNDIEAIVIRTTPNDTRKKSRKYSNTNPPYLSEEAADFFRELGVKHLLIDLPSVDKEKDQGALLAHKAFWNYHGKQRLDATITEFIYVSDSIVDGLYMLNLQVAPIENDASPSRPILYKILDL
ncbi:MAG: metal-dependent hydrolase [Bacteroidetes bacterium MedPE-SWsnd-G1]|nr:MAG: metal-dependent hydrolase [Bacteroidetes bacterium MedPE-SWsnd-G1]